MTVSGRATDHHGDPGSRVRKPEEIGRRIAVGDVVLSAVERQDPPNVEHVVTRRGRLDAPLTARSAQGEIAQRDLGHRADMCCEISWPWCLS